MKTCSKCGEEKDVGEFPTGRKKCKVCMAEYQHNYCRSEKGRATKRKYNQSEAGKKSRYKYDTKPMRRNQTILRKRLNRFLIKGNDTQKSRDIIGCTRDELRARYESLFKPGMTWENYGEWENDHIIPMSKFDLSKDEEVKKCMHYSNLQPLWRKENILKSNN